MFNLGTYYLEGISIEKNPNEAFYWMNKAAEINISDAMVQLVEMYQNGIGVEKNTVLAAKWRDKLWD
jgi:TPR repeat protein